MDKKQEKITQLVMLVKKSGYGELGLGWGPTPQMLRQKPARSKWWTTTLSISISTQTLQGATTYCQVWLKRHMSAQGAYRISELQQLALYLNLPKEGLGSLCYIKVGVLGKATQISLLMLENHTRTMYKPGSYCCHYRTNCDIFFDANGAVHTLLPNGGLIVPVYDV